MSQKTVVQELMADKNSSTLTSNEKDISSESIIASGDIYENILISLKSIYLCTIFLYYQALQMQNKRLVAFQDNRYA